MARNQVSAPSVSPHEGPSAPLRKFSADDWPGSLNQRIYRSRRFGSLRLPADRSRQNRPRFRRARAARDHHRWRNSRQPELPAWHFGQTYASSPKRTVASSIISSLCQPNRLRVGNVSDVSADFSVGPQKISCAGQHLLHFIVCSTSAATSEQHARRRHPHQFARTAEKIAWPACPD